MTRLFLPAFALLLPLPVLAQDKALTPETREFFEKKVRPVLAEHCYSCHSTSAKKVKAGLLLDSRAGMLEGGDLGPALVPGYPDKSRLIEAVRYQNVDLKMPPKNKLTTAVIEDLTAWVQMGAPWPSEKALAKSSATGFDLYGRKKEHWSWQPIGRPGVPKVQNQAWPRGDIDRFLLAKLEEKGLKPAAPADPRTLLRRLYFDIIGLPPPREEVADFIKVWTAPHADTQAVLASTVDRLLASPRFGERWGRHWLDLVRYAESRGHEFDYSIPNAYEYRDYVIRALNADVPYNQFVQEHLAGDLFPQPRLHPAEHFNESILGTAFWFLGEELHSPVDIRQDQADRFDNRLDVMTKTFLGLTVSCARCHDHKFDAISTKDYYALFGILESCSYRLARFDTLEHNRIVAERLWKLRAEIRPHVQKYLADATDRTINQMDAILLAAAGKGPSSKLDPETVKRWSSALTLAQKDTRSPLHAFAQAANRKGSLQEVFRPILKSWQAMDALDSKQMDVIVDYRQTPVKGWLPDDVTFGPGPSVPGDIILGTSPGHPIGRVVEQGAAERDRVWDGLRLAQGAQKEPGSLGGVVRAGRTLRTPEFSVKDGNVYALVKGSGMIYTGVAQHIMIAGPLHATLVQKFNTGDKFQWLTLNLTAYKGQFAHLEFTPNPDADFALALVAQGPKSPDAYVDSPYRFLARRLERASSLTELAHAYQETFALMAKRLAADQLRGKDSHEDLTGIANWFVQNSEMFLSSASEDNLARAQAMTPWFEKHKALIAEIKLESRVAPAMQEGGGTDETVFIRGNPRAAGERVPRRFLEALSGPAPLAVARGSGRLELARQMTDSAVTPFITRVYVNRIWHHLFGRGLVASVDNFGVLGEAPTHPELLDYLAVRFAQGGGGFDWSTKKLIHALVLTQAYQMSAHPNTTADEVDPQNLLLHRTRIRRLEGEAIRDSILRVSGRLNPTMYGPPVPVFLTAFQDGRGKPASGPLDGDGRRSIYLSVRRNFLSSFLLAFDTPSPFSTVGRRTISNVPAQALILMNDPFVHNQAETWAKRVQSEKGSTPDRIRNMYLDAFSRPPTDIELNACLRYLQGAPEARRWTDLAHVLFNTKEFFFVN